MCSNFKQARSVQQSNNESSIYTRLRFLHAFLNKLFTVECIVYNRFRVSIDHDHDRINIR